MIAASMPVERGWNAKLLVVDHCGQVEHRARSEFVSILRPGDVVIANDAATLPASLSGRHRPSGRGIEVRLACHNSPNLNGIKHFSAVAFGAGDFRMRTEDRPKPPTLNPGDRLELGPLRATVLCLLNHPRFISLEFDGSPREIWEGLARHGRPIQYSHVSAPLALWDTWTSIASLPVAFESPSAGFALNWSVLASMRAHGIGFGTITYAAGISSTGDVELDSLLPFAEPYSIPQSTALLIRRAQVLGKRVVAIGTTVARALEHTASLYGSVRAGEGLATLRIGASTRLRVVDAILSGTHERGTSHYELLRAFADEQALARMDEALNAHGYHTHEFGDSVFVEAANRCMRSECERSTAA